MILSYAFILSVSQL